MDLVTIVKACQKMARISPLFGGLETKGTICGR
jgi:hypothetical protein